MTAMEAPHPTEQLTVVPANEASWDDLAAIFGTEYQQMTIRSWNTTTKLLTLLDERS